MEEKKRVIVIDDDFHILETVRKLLERHGYEVHTRNTAFDSTNFIVRHNPDAVLLDVNMPFLSGDKLVEIMKDHSKARRVPVILFSSNDENSLRKMVRETGAFGYISKSEMGEELASRVDEMIERARKFA